MVLKTNTKLRKIPMKKSSLIVENAWEQRMFTTMEKKEFDIQNTPVHI